MATSRATSPGSRRLSEVARLVSVPTGIVTTGWDDVETTCRKMGIGFDEWQRGAGRIILGKRANGKLAAMIDGVGMSLPRQVGKTYLLSGIIFALCILRPNTLVIWSAHHSKTHEETFLSMQGFAQRHRVAPYVLKTYTGSGDEEVRFRNGSRILFGARDRGFGRGIPGVDILVFDEAQILSERALDAILATMNVSKFGLALYIGTPPRPEDMSESFTRMRDDAMAGKLPNGAWIECGADPDADPNDRAQWAKANPSFPTRTPVESILRLQGKLSAESFKREGLGIWDPKAAGGVIPRDSWDMCGDETSLAVDRFSLGIEVGPDQSSAAVVLAGARADGRWHVELDEHRKGATWLVPYVSALVAANPQIRAVVGDVGGPLASFVTKDARGRYLLTGTKVVVTAPTVKELGAACSNLLVAVVTAAVAHLQQPQLTGAVAVADKRALADTGMWVFHRMSSASDITPIQAAALALMGAQSDNIKRPGRQRTEGAPKRRAVVL